MSWQGIGPCLNLLLYTLVTSIPPDPFSEGGYQILVREWSYLMFILSCSLVPAQFYLPENSSSLSIVPSSNFFIRNPFCTNSYD
jgi:hypothetical protein